MIKLTRNQRIALGVLTFSSAALIADKTVLSPQAAQAEVTAELVVPSTTGDVIKSPGSRESMTSNLQVVSLWIEQNEIEPSGTDPFAWKLPQQNRVAESAELSFEETAKNWSLTAIMGTPGYRIAVMNGKPVRVNEVVDFSLNDDRQAKIVEIREDSVVLYYNGQTVSVELPVTRISGV